MSPVKNDADAKEVGAGDRPRKSAANVTFKLQRTISRRMALMLLYAMDIVGGWEGICAEESAALSASGEPGGDVEFLGGMNTLVREEFKCGVTSEIFRKAWTRARKLARGVDSHRREIDTMISAAATNWDLHRINEVDRNLLRLAVYEMRHADPVISPGIAINEAVEMAHDFGQKDSWRFVNGVLDRIRRITEQEPLVLGGK